MPKIYKKPIIDFFVCLNRNKRAQVEIGKDAESCDLENDLFRIVLSVVSFTVFFIVFFFRLSVHPEFSRNPPKIYMYMYYIEFLFFPSRFLRANLSIFFLGQEEEGK